MAGEWLKFESNLPDKPETLAITAAMGWDDPDLTVGKLMRVFRWFDQQTIDGNALGVTPALLDRLIGVTGFVQAMANAGWIAVSDAGLRLKNFEKHNGASAKARAQTAKRVANFRAEHQPEQPLASGNAATVTTALAREEKRRKEKNTPLPPKGADRFAEFWAAWPKHERKQDRKDCLAKWAAQGLDSVADAILADVQAKKSTRKWREGFIEAPEVYINRRRWEDGTSDAGGDWWTNAGFPTQADAENAGCYAHNAASFRDGKRLEAA